MSILEPRQFVDHIPARIVPGFLRKRTAIELWIPEVLRKEDIAVDEWRTEAASLIGPTFAQRVVNVECEIAREPPAEGCLQGVVDHRLLAAQVITAQVAECRIRTRARLPVEGVYERTMQREISAVRADIVDLSHECGSKRAFEADQRLHGIRIRQMRADQRANSTAHDSLASFIQGPREAGTRSEIEVISIVRFVGTAKPAEVHFPKIGGGIEVHDLSRSARCGLDSDDKIVVITQPKIQNELPVHAPIILNEYSELIEVTIMRRLAVHKNDRVRNVRKQIIHVLKGHIGVLRIGLVTALAIPPESHLHVVSSDDSTEL